MLPTAQSDHGLGNICMRYSVSRSTESTTSLREDWCATAIFLTRSTSPRHSRRAACSRVTFVKASVADTRSPSGPSPVLCKSPSRRALSVRTCRVLSHNPEIVCRHSPSHRQSCYVSGYEVRWVVIGVLEALHSVVLSRRTVTASLAFVRRENDLGGIRPQPDSVWK